MSALTNGPDTVTVTTMIAVAKDRVGSNVLGPGPKRTYSGVSVQPAGLSAFGKAEANNVIDADYVIYKALEPAWIGGPHSVIDWNGQQFEQVGIVKRFGRGRRSRHEVIKIQARGTAVK